MVVKRRSSAERRAQIIEKATQLFAGNGYKKVTMGSVAQACRVTEPALYRHFPSKSDLYDAVLMALKDRLNIDTVLAELEASEDIGEVLYGLARYVVNTYSKNTELSRLLLFSALEGHPLARRTFQDLRGVYVKFLTEKLRELDQKGKIRSIHPEITARCFVGMVTDCSLSMHLWRKLQGKTYDPEQIIQNNVPIYVAGLKAKQD